MIAVYILLGIIAVMVLDQDTYEDIADAEYEQHERYYWLEHYDERQKSL